MCARGSGGCTSGRSAVHSIHDTAERHCTPCPAASGHIPIGWTHCGSNLSRFMLQTLAVAFLRLENTRPSRWYSSLRQMWPQSIAARNVLQSLFGDLRADTDTRIKHGYRDGVRRKSRVNATQMDPYVVHNLSGKPLRAFCTHHSYFGPCNVFGSIGGMASDGLEWAWLAIVVACEKFSEIIHLTVLDGVRVCGFARPKRGQDLYAVILSH